MGKYEEGFYREWLRPMSAQLRRASCLLRVPVRTVDESYQCPATVFNPLGAVNADSWCLVQ